MTFSAQSQEDRIRKFWDTHHLFEQSVEQRPKDRSYVFYDGPPFATGLPHYGHIVASTMKDVIPRYWTMRGYRVERQWGWDCHGLPIENLIEQELKLKNKRDIEKIGVETFNAACRTGVLRYVDEWKKFIPRIGRWVDMENAYTTMDTPYTESIWWAFKVLHDKGLIYEGKKSMHLCPRCGTPLSNFEVTQGYKEITDQSVIVKFQLQDEPETFLLAWTTTPWTLPGNVGLAVKEDVDYVKAKVFPEAGQSVPDGREEYVILAKEILEDEKWKEGDGEYIFHQKRLRVIKALKGKELVGKRYTPLFGIKNWKLKIENLDNGWQVVSDTGIDFITLDEGTGIVHIAPAFGEDDMQIGEKYSLPFIQHVDQDGRFIDAVTEWAGELVKPKGDPQQTDKKIVAWLEEQGHLFSSAQVKHSYPHCWRCDTPLLNYATSSWFVKVTDLKERMIKHNQEIHWVPTHVRDGRFGKWLEGARDWAISRRRYWGAPLPVWRCQAEKSQTDEKSEIFSGSPEDPRSLFDRANLKSAAGCGNVFVAGSIADIPWPTKLKNTYWLVRHGECTHNIEGLAAPDERELKLSTPLSSLTKKGKEQIKDLGVFLHDKHIDVIESSDLFRTKETAEGIAKALHLSVRYNPLLREIREGDNNMKSLAEIQKTQKPEDRFEQGAPGGGESLNALRERMLQAFRDIESRYEGKTIAIVSHGDPLWVLEAAVQGVWGKELFTSFYPKPGSAHRLYDIPVDLHRPIIDHVTFPCAECGGVMHRIPDVFDCWFESESMPFAQRHYPFAQKELFEKTFPAQFIAEGLDQTRGWFYTLLVLSTGLFDQPPFRNVIVNGLVLAEDGKKMSKRLKNYPAPEKILETYGADALRYYLLTSPVMQAEDLRFSEQGVREAHQKVIMILQNVLRFYEISQDGTQEHKSTREQEHKNILDKWIMARLEQLVFEVTEAMDAYDLPRATRPIGEFIQDLSTWYVRRSRDRLKSKVASRLSAQAGRSKASNDAERCLTTLREVLRTLAKVMAPFTPFLAEHVYQSVSGHHFEDGEKSVHLEEWPEIKKTQKQKNKETIKEMEMVRKIVEMGHALREEVGVKTRQPLANFQFSIFNFQCTEAMKKLIQDELHVKDVEQVENLKKSEGWVLKEERNMTVALNTVLTPELEAEGIAREFSRQVNALRKKQGLTPRDSIVILYGQIAQKILDAIETQKEGIKMQTIAEEIKYDATLESEDTLSMEKQSLPIKIFKTL